VLEVPPGLTIYTSTGPVVPLAGVETDTLIVVFVDDVIVAALPPKNTWEVLAKFVPAIETEVPPAVVPLAGVTEVMFGRIAESVFFVRSTARVPSYLGVQDPLVIKESTQSAFIVVTTLDCEVPAKSPTGEVNTSAGRIEFAIRH